MRYPEITKKTSTPINPPVSISSHAWKITTMPTAIVLGPSMSGL